MTLREEPSTDEALRQKLEPGGVPSVRRFAMLKAFAPTKVHTGLHTMPIIPLLSDSDENLESLFAGGADAKVDCKDIVKQMIDKLKGLTYLKQ